MYTDNVQQTHEKYLQFSFLLGIMAEINASRRNITVIKTPAVHGSRKESGVVSRQEVKHIAELADIGITDEELEEFTQQFNSILEYFGILDQVPEAGSLQSGTCNVMREDGVVPSLSHDDVVRLAGETEDGYIKAPRVM